MDMTHIQDEIIAYHEAAHAVIAILLRKPFQYATVIRQGDSLGHVKRIKDDWEMFNRRICVKDIMFLCAGPLMDERFGIKTHSIVEGSDLETAGFIADVKNIDDNVVNKCMYATDELLTAYVTTIEAVKQELEAFKRLPYSRIRAVVKANTAIPSYEAANTLLSRVWNPRHSLEDFKRSRRITWAGDWPYDHIPRCMYWR